MGLVLPQTVKVRIHAKNREHYRNKGYKFKKCNEIIEVNVLDLVDGSHELVQCECDYCGAAIKIEYRKYIESKNNNKLLCCNNGACRGKKSKDTCMKKYNVTNVSQLQEIKDKKVETCRKHFGVDCSFQSDEVQDKRIKTLKEKYGKDIINVSQVKEIQDKIKVTSQERYGVDNPAQSNIVQDKIKATNQERYGCTCSFQSEEVKKKSKETMMKNHGVEHALQNKEIYNRMKATCKEKYGNENYLASNDFKNKTRDTWSFNGHDGPCSRQQKYIANLINGKINVVISGYWTDIFMEKENIVIEYDGGGHFLKDKMNGYVLPTKESLLHEKQREDKIINDKHRMIRFIATKDRIPSDETIINLIEGFKNSDFKVIRIDFEESTIDRDYKEKWHCNFGKLRRITKKDLEPFEKQEEKIH